MFSLSVVDPGDEFTLNIRGGLPDNSVLEEIAKGEYVFRWKLQEVMTEPLVFVANDTRGASSIFVPTVEVCACVNGGNCTLDGLLTSDPTIVMNCICSDGGYLATIQRPMCNNMLHVDLHGCFNSAFTGNFCEEDRNGCSEIQCFEGVECMDVPAPGVGAVCGACPPGYTGNAQKCYGQRS